ncbi:ALP1-like protein [Tanacetum coccineum]
MMSDSSGDDLSDLDDIDDLEMIMQQVQAEQEQEEEVERVRHRNYIYRERLDAEERYLRKPDFNDIQNLYTAHNNIHGFPRMLGSIDCMHWEWRNCPKGWHGQYARGDKKYPTIMLEAVASYDLWIWHAFFVAGANNDLTVLNNSPLFDDLLDDIAPMAPFECNGVTFEKGYYLADGIYPQWASFVKSFTVTSSEKNILYKRKQEGARKDIERAFGVLQGRCNPIEKDKMKNNKEASTKESLEYPPGFTPRENDVENVEMDNQKDNCDCEFENVNNISDEVNFSSGFNTYKKAGGESMDSDHCRESKGSRKVLGK